MDPNKLLAQMLRKAQLLAEMNCSNCFAELLSDDVFAMNEWLSKGGFLPDAWAKTPTKIYYEVED